MDKNIEGDKYLDYLDETSEGWLNFRVVPLDVLLASLAGFRQLMKNLIASKKLITGRTGMQ